MYITITGDIEESKIRQIQDAVNFNFSLDDKDIPFSNYGIPQSMSVASPEELFEQIRVIFSDLQQQSWLDGVSIVSISIDKNNQNNVELIMEYNGKPITLGVEL